MLIIIALALLVILVVMLIYMLMGQKRKNDELSAELKRLMADELRAGRLESAETQSKMMQSFGSAITDVQSRTSEVQDKRLMELSDNLREGQNALLRNVSASLLQMEERLNGFAAQNEQQLQGIRASVETRLNAMQEDNNKKLDAMREVVDEKLQKTLNERLNQSFGLVSARLEEVYKGLGEMQTLASGVGDLKKVLSNVKTRGILGELQLGAILEQILSPSQYVSNVVTKKGTQNFVEYAIVLPGDGDEPVYLPIDAKFPADLYSRLVDAYDAGDQAAVTEAARALELRIKQCAKDIRDKYIDPPNTTDFGILFLPFEGLYAEAVRRDMVEKLSRDYKITIAGPTTMAALLNSLQMGFRTLAIQKHSSEVWAVLGGVKTEFEKFGEALSAAQKKILAANDEIDKLVGVRTRAIQRKLKGVTSLPEGESGSLFDE
ncbi:MAG: DNA recombination protein RmuC [Clostridia bacterium]|nr:DNA recombination protein RmuC [Clostridia bacterium]